MDIQLEANRYLDYIIQNTQGFKALLCDNETLKFISVAMTRTELYKQEVFVVDELASFVRRPIDPKLESFSCICILRPTKENINLLCTELQKPHFPRYNLYFTSSIDEEQIRSLALNDSQVLIQELQEVYIDFSALSARLFSLNIYDISEFRKFPTPTNCPDRIVQGLYASICSLQLKPIIRYEKNSSITEIVASKLSDLVQQNSVLFQGHQNDSALILILDRRNDPVTPLLHSFYYYSILHDLFTIDNNTVKCGSNEFIIDERNDTEVKEIGTLFLSNAGEAVSGNLNNVIQTGKDINDTKISSMNDKMLQYLQGSNQVKIAKNHQILYESAVETIKGNNLFEITALEQLIATSDYPKYQYEQLVKFINDPNCSPENALRLAILFILHYKDRNNDSVMKLLQSKCNWQGNEMLYPKTLLSIFGYDKKNDPNFKKPSVITNIMEFLGMGNNQAYQLYQTPIEYIIKKIKDKKLDPEKYPYIDNNRRGQPQKVIIFYVGGATYLEHAMASKNSDKTSYQFIVGGTTIHNAESFLRYEVEPFCFDIKS